MDPGVIMEILTERAGKARQETDPLNFTFVIKKEGHPASEAIRDWFVEMNLEYEVRSGFFEDRFEFGHITFSDPSLAVLFKLRFA